MVVEQNLKTTSMDVMKALGQQVRLLWNKEHVRYVEAHDAQPRLDLPLPKTQASPPALVAPSIVWFVVVYLGAR